MTRYIVKTESGISGTCNLGDGPTRSAAMIDAFGPKPWSPYTKKIAKRVWVEEVETDEDVDYSGH
jgi:hypothetical protein